ncbi:unnamed protein product [Heligmosomoides polygyrus]|uniref:Acetoacetyl-CoA synthetase n=1 Tax=Heligmosomoides polygyrus TaxID=6339 RepID=A0A3P7YN17_HELPZ|nr:unnamed protein product [Heligmosomoides polygyrus]
MVTSNSIIGRTPSVKSSTTFYQPKDIKGTQESELKRVIEEKFATYRDLHKWSCENNADFWETMLIFSDIKLGSKYLEVVEPNKHIADFPQWFRGATLNYTENCLRGRDEDVAFMSASELLDTKCQLVSYTYLTLRNDVSILATALRQFGIVQGDVICGFLPNSYQTAVAMFATAAIGATWSSASVDFGPSGVLDRFKQVDPKVLFTVEAVTYKGKRFDLKEKLDRIVSGAPQFLTLTCHSRSLAKVDFSAYLHGDKYESLDSFVSSVKNIPSPFVFEQVPFSHPLFIMFSSGTTGIPKAMVHTVGGTLLKHVEEHLIQGNSRSCDRIMFYTTCGWMMWNWLMSFIYCGGSIVLFDESPLEPDPHIVLKVAAESKSTIIGMGAKLYDEYLRMNVDFKSLYDLRNIRLVYSTGSPLKSAAFEFINGSIAPEAVIGSISGGTDIIGCFMGCSLSLPVHPGECQCLYLGMDVKALDRNGQPVEDRQGELVCLKPFPSMPSHFLGDTNHARYKKAYFERFEGVWAHGDFCQISSKTGGVIMLGRSDATLNRGGVRIGTAEIYSVVETFPEIDDCIVAGQLVPDFDDEHILLFVKMADLFTLTDDLKRRICLQIRTMMSPRHVPNAIYAVKDIPYTNSGKKVELAVKQIINGEQMDERVIRGIYLYEFKLGTTAKEADEKINAAFGQGCSTIRTAYR